jgi:hypothetical protein
VVFADERCCSSCCSEREQAGEHIGLILATTQTLDVVHVLVVVPYRAPSARGTDCVAEARQHGQGSSVAAQRTRRGQRASAVRIGTVRVGGVEQAIEVDVEAGYLDVWEVRVTFAVCMAVCGAGRSWAEGGGGKTVGRLGIVGGDGGAEEARHRAEREARPGPRADRRRWVGARGRR